MRKLNQQNGVSSSFIKKGKALLATTAMTAVSLIPFSNTAHADPAWSDFNDVQGSTITDTTSQANTTLINQLSGTYVGTSANLDIAANQSVIIGQNTTNSSFTAIANGANDDPTRILGVLKTVIKDSSGEFTDQRGGALNIFDRNGVVFGVGSRVDVGSIIASAANTTFTSVDGGKTSHTFTNFGDGKIINNGTITVAEAGIAAFVAPTVVNNGVINARLSNVVMAAGETVTLDMYGDGLVEVAVDGELADGIIRQNGTINAQGGNVLVSAAIAKDAVDNVINMDGVTTVSSAVVKGGKIVLSGGKSGRVNVKGALNANGVGDQNAGSIDVTGEDVRVTSTGRVRANAQNEAEAGDINLLADNKLTINGRVSAQGLADTGFIETSAPTTNISAGASILATREWLLDPTDITIDEALSLHIENQLAVGDMTVMTPVAGTDEGDIGVQAIIDWSTDKTFKLVAADDVFISAVGGGINATGAGNFVVEAGDDFRMNAGNNSINTNGGNVTITTGDEVTIDGGVINANGGDILIDNAEQFQAVADSLQTSGTGTIALNQNKDANGFTSTTDATIQNAVNAINNSGTGESTVLVGAGTWVESVGIDKAVTVEGAGRNDTIVTPGAGNNGFTIDGTINGKVEIKKLAVTGGKAGVRVNDTADVEKLIVANTLMQNNALHGVSVFGDSVGKTIIRNSNFIDNGAGGGSAGEGDILFYLHNGDIELTNIDIQNNSAPDTADYGIQIIGSNPSEPTSLPLRNAGEISLDKVKVAGNYRAALLGIQEYLAIDNLSMTDVSLGGQTNAGTDSAGWASLFVSNLGTSDIDLGNINFDSVNGQYISMGTDAASTFPAPPTYVTANNIDATAATFEGIVAADLTVEESFDVEDKIFHKIDFAPQGLVTWQDDNVFVSQASSFVGGAIQRGVDASSVGGTVHVQAGNYTEDVVIDKELKLKGYDAVLNSAGGVNLITVTASNVNIDPLTFDGLGLADYGVNATGLGAIGLTVDGNTFKNFNKAGVFVAANGVGTGSIINNTFEGSSTRGIETGDLDGGYTLDIADNVIGTNSDTVQNGIKFGRLRNATINVSGGSMDTSGDAIAGGNVGSNVALNLTNQDIEAGDEAADFNGNVDGQVTISGGTLIGAGSGFEANFIGGNGELVIKDGAIVEGNHASHGYGINILRNRIDGSVVVTESTVKGGHTGIGSDNGLMNVNGSLDVSNSNVEGVNGDGIETGDVLGSVTVSNGSNITGGQNAIEFVGNLDGADIDVKDSTIEGNDNGIVAAGAEILNGTTINIDNNTKIAATNGVAVWIGDNTAGGATVSVSGNQDITAGLEGIKIEQINDVVVDGNTINTATDGILVDGSDNYAVTDNTISNTDDNGIKVVSSDDGFVQGNDITNAGHNGIAVIDSDNATVNMMNSIDGTSSAGVALNRTTNSLVDGNEISNTGGSGVWINQADGSTVSNNEIDTTWLNGSRSTGAGVHVVDTLGATVSGNDIENVTRDGSGVEVITSDDVIVDDNNIDNATNGVRVTDSADVTVSNNEIDDVTEAGISVANSDDAQIVGNEINDNGASTFTEYGILVEGGNSVDVDDNKIEETTIAGIAANNTTYIDIDDNLIKDGKDGILVDGGDHADIRRNETRDMSDDGIQVKSHADVEIEDNNKVIRSADSGITVSNSARAEIDGNDVDVAENGIRVTNSANAKVTNNDVDDADNSGIWLKNSNNAEVANNFINDNGASTFVDYGILIEGGNSVDVEFNKVEEASVAGIAADDTTFVNIDDNLVKDSGTGISVDGGTNADIRRNTVQDMSDNGIEVSSNDNVDVEGNVINRVDGHGIAISRSNRANIDLNEINGAGFDGINVNRGFAADITNNKISDVEYDAIDVTLNEFVDIINNEIDGAGDNGIEVGLSLAADVNENKITGAGNDGINVDSSAGAQIKDNMIYGQADASSRRSGESTQGAGRDGIHVENSTNVVIDDNTIKGDSANFRKDGLGAGRHGIFVSGGDTRFLGSGVKVTNNNILGDSGFFHSSDSVGSDGIHIEDNGAGRFGSDPLVSGNIIEKTGVDGIDVEDTDDVQITNNTIRRAGDDGIEVEGGSDAYIFDNTITLSGDDGIDVDDNSDIEITGNTISGTGSSSSDGNGIEVSDSSDAEITNNIISLTSSDGIEVDDSDDAIVRMNNISLTLGDGIDIDESDDVEVNENTLTAILGNGIKVSDSDETLIEENVISFVGQNGIYVNPSDFVSILNNEISFSGEDGIHVEDGFDIEISNNIIDESGDDGIDVKGNLNVTVDNNQVSNSVSDGIRVIGTDGFFEQQKIEFAGPSIALITNNIVSESGTDGIEVGGFEEILLEENDASNSTENGLNVSGGFNGDVEVSGNTFTNNDVGALFVSGDIDLTGDGNTFDGGRVGMRFEPLDIEEEDTFIESPEQVGFPILENAIFSIEPTGLSLVDNTIGAQTFDGQTESYVELANGALFEPGTPTLLNALDSTYVGTPFGTFTPNIDFADGFPVDVVAFLESQFVHFNDNGNTGLFVFPLLPEIDQEDLLQFFGPNAASLSGLNVTILGLPGIPGGTPVALNNLTPAAGGEFDPTDPASLNAIETAAGGEEAGCWGDATAQAGAGPVSLSYGGSAEDLLNSEASCGS